MAAVVAVGLVVQPGPAYAHGDAPAHSHEVVCPKDYLSDGTIRDCTMDPIGEGSVQFVFINRRHTGSFAYGRPYLYGRTSGTSGKLLFGSWNQVCLKLTRDSDGVVEWLRLSIGSGASTYSAPSNTYGAYITLDDYTTRYLFGINFTSGDGNAQCAAEDPGPPPEAQESAGPLSDLSCSASSYQVGETWYANFHARFPAGYELPVGYEDEQVDVAIAVWHFDWEPVGHPQYQGPAGNNTWTVIPLGDQGTVEAITHGTHPVYGVKLPDLQTMPEWGFAAEFEIIVTFDPAFYATVPPSASDNGAGFWDYVFTPSTQFWADKISDAGRAAGNWLAEKVVGVQAPRQRYGQVDNGRAQEVRTSCVALANPVVGDIAFPPTGCPEGATCADEPGDDEPPGAFNGCGRGEGTASSDGSTVSYRIPIVGPIADRLRQGFEWVSDVTRSVADLVLSLACVLERLFIPDELPFGPVIDAFKGTFPFSELFRIDGLGTQVSDYWDNAKAGDDGCLVVDVTDGFHAPWPAGEPAPSSSWRVVAPTPSDSGCTEGLLASARTADDDTLGDLFGFRGPLRAALRVLLWLAVFYRVVRAFAPGGESSRQLELTP